MRYRCSCVVVLDEEDLRREQQEPRHGQNAVDVQRGVVARYHEHGIIEPSLLLAWPADVDVLGLVEDILEGAAVKSAGDAVDDGTGEGGEADDDGEEGEDAESVQAGLHGGEAEGVCLDLAFIAHGWILFIICDQRVLSFCIRRSL